MFSFGGAQQGQQGQNNNNNTGTGTGTGQQQQQGHPQQQQQGLFGSTTASPATMTFGATNNTQSSGLFGGGAGAGNASSFGTTPSMFGASQQQQPSTTPSLFGGAGGANQPKPAASTNMFGSSNQPVTTTPSLFGGGGANQPAATTPSLFGAAPAPAAPKPAATPSLFGANTNVTPNPTPSLFGAPAATTAAAPKPGGLFGAAPSANTSTGQPSATPSLFGGTSTTNAAAAKPATPSLFGAAATNTAAPSTTAAPVTNTTQAPSSSLFGASILKPPAGPLKVDDLGKTPGSTAIAQKAPQTTTTTGGLVTSKPATGSISVLKNKSVEDILYKWSTELDSFTREFQRQAIQIQKWDLAIVSNGALVTQLFNELQEVEGVEREIEQNLEYIEAQQTELESALESYAAQVQTIISQDSATPNARFRNTPADEDREKAYVLAEHLNTKLDDMASSLSVCITELNRARKEPTTAPGVEESPLESITQILNAHLTSLEWIERSAAKLEGRVEKLRGLEKGIESKMIR